MAIVGIVLISLIVIWILALNIDARFFRGRLLIKDKITADQLKQNLSKALTQKEKLKEEWESDSFIWFFDYFFNVPLLDQELENLRIPIVDSLKAHDSEPYLDSETIRLVEDAITKLK